MIHDFIDKLYLENYRNLSLEAIQFSPKVNCIFGNNGNGKTNILEAIYYLVKKKSFRKKNTFAQIVSLDCDQRQIIFSTSLQSNDKSLYYSGRINQDGFIANLNQRPWKKKLPIDLFLIKPFDAYEFFNSSSWRRNWIDQCLSLLNSQYSSSLYKFGRALRNRNFLITQSSHTADFKHQMSAYDQQLAIYGREIILERKRQIKRLTQYAAQGFEEIFKDSIELEIQYDPQIEGDEKEFIYNYYQEGMAEDVKNRSTRRGLHLDDYTVYLNRFSSQDYGSTGQQKLAFYSLFFGFLELFKGEKKRYPMVLIDDISGELDSLRWKNLIQYLDCKEFQVLITTANREFEKEIRLGTHCKSLEIKDGRIMNDKNWGEELNE